MVDNNRFDAKNTSLGDIKVPKLQQNFIKDRSTDKKDAAQKQKKAPLTERTTDAKERATLSGQPADQAKKQ